jgi:hypothetical protein
VVHARWFVEAVLAAAREAPRLVPQLALTDLDPIKVAFAPDDATLLMSVNSNGRIDLFDNTPLGALIELRPDGLGVLSPIRKTSRRSGASCH